MLTERENKVLKIIVEDYIRNVKPVSSSLICNKLGVSSATIRNEMSMLEDKGFLEKAHVSSGRIPSTKGYEYYVNNLLNLKKISGEDVLKLQLIFQNKNLEISDAIKESLEIVAEMTELTAVKLGQLSSDNAIKEVRAIPLDENNIVVVVITDKGYVENKNINISGLDPREVENVINLINNLIAGTSIKKVSEKLEFEIKPVISSYVNQHEAFYNEFIDLFNDIIKKDICVRGKKNILKIPEFKDKSYEIFDYLDEDNLEDCIKIDDKNDIEVIFDNSLGSDLTIVKTGYKSCQENGSIAIVGPKRMDYERVINMLRFIKEMIDEKGN